MGSLNVLWLLAILRYSAGQPAVSSTVFVAGYSQSISGYGDPKYPPRGVTSPSPAPYFISKLNFDSIPGMIVVGAADWLYILNQNLSSFKEINLPPQASTSACSAAIGYNPDYVCRNHLRVFPSSPTDPTRLVVCGSEAIGTPSCRAVNISNYTTFTTVTAANGMVSIRPDFYGNGIAYNDVSNPRGINFFSVSTLNLDANNTGLFFLTVSYTNPTDPNSLYTVLQLRTNSIANFKAPVFVDTYRANYAPRTALLPGVMDTISPDEHKYFYVFVRDTDSTNRIISQLVRVCQNDPGNSGDNAPLTLVKARINCISATYSTNYNAISGVAFNQMGRYYQNGDWSLFMYGVFTTTIGGVPVSAVCVYPANNSVDDATGRFGRNGGVFDIFRTLLVNPNTGLQTTSGYVECTPNGNLARPDYTYTDTVLPITQIGTEPLAVFNGVTVTKIVLDQTCVVTNNINARSCVTQDVLFLGTAAGTVLKVAMGYSSSVVPVISEEIKLDDTSSVRQMEIQQQGGVKYLYVNTDTSIYRLPVQRCGRYLSCSACVGSRDPYCVWNTALSQCVVSSIVPTINGASATVPNGTYQNIHTGYANCSVVDTPVPTTSVPFIVTTAAQRAVTMTPAMTPAMTPIGTTTENPVTTSPEAVAPLAILSGIPSISIVAALGGLCLLEFLMLFCCCCCLVCRRGRLPNPSDPTFLKTDVFANPALQDEKPLMQHIDRNSVYFRSVSESDGGQCQIPESNTYTQGEKVYDTLIVAQKPGTNVAASTIQQYENVEAPDTSLTAI
ncbi:hypothetical protein EMCRGX_G006297 [Ephydatia muelleri]